MKNQIRITREIDGIRVHAVANYVPRKDHWNCQVRELRDGEDVFETRYGSRHVTLELWDMIDLCIEHARKRAPAFVPPEDCGREIDR